MSTKLHQAVPGFDEVIDADASDFGRSGLKVPSVIRVARLGVVSGEMLVGRIGEISEDRLRRVQKGIGRLDPGCRIATWNHSTTGCASQART